MFTEVRSEVFHAARDMLTGLIGARHLLRMYPLLRPPIDHATISGMVKDAISPSGHETMGLKATERSKKNVEDGTKLCAL